ncbi:MAG: VTT domain-containing protein [Candidatus Omnitrophica bacterium]|nr:VTT domain-containing protein [Candidatus Omnitrophota bacterium]
MKHYSKPTIRFILFVAVFVGLVFIGKIFSVDTQNLYSYLDNIPKLYSSLFFLFFYVVGTFFIWYLKDPLKIIGALCFGAYLSTGLIYLAEIINASIFFFFSYKLGKDFVAKKIKGKFSKLYEKLGNLDFKWIFLLRVIPLIPYRVLDLSFGLSRVPFRKYIIVVLLGSLPRIFFHQFPLALLRDFSFKELSEKINSNPFEIIPLLYQKMSEYFLSHPLIHLWFFLYVVFAFFVIIKFRKHIK